LVKLKFQKASRISGRPSYYVFDIETNQFLFLHWNSIFKSWSTIIKLEHTWSEERIEEIKTFIFNLEKPDKPKEENLGNMSK